MLSFLYVYSHHSILECYNLFSGVELSMRSFFVIMEHQAKSNEAYQNDQMRILNLDLPTSNHKKRDKQIKCDILIQMYSNRKYI